MTNTQTSLETQVPFYRPDLNENEVEEGTAALKSGWLTSGPRVRRFEGHYDNNDAVMRDAAASRKVHERLRYIREKIFLLLLALYFDSDLRVRRHHHRAGLR